MASSAAIWMRKTTFFCTFSNSISQLVPGLGPHAMTLDAAAKLRTSGGGIGYVSLAMPRATLSFRIDRKLSICSGGIGRLIR